MQKKLWKSKTQDYRDDGKVINLLNCGHVSDHSSPHISVCLLERTFGENMRVKSTSNGLADIQY